MLGPLTNPRWADVAQTAILLDTTWNDVANTYLATPGDINANGRDIYDRALAEEFGAVAAYVAPVIPLATLATRAIASVSDAATRIIAGVMPDEAHKSAFQNAAAILNGNGGLPPTEEPLGSAFAALATSYGLSPSSFAAIVIGSQALSMTLTAVLATFNTLAPAAASKEALLAELTSTETALSNIVANVNALLPWPITPPASIVIAGLTD